MLILAGTGGIGLSLENHLPPICDDAAADHGVDERSGEQRPDCVRETGLCRRRSGQHVGSQSQGCDGEAQEHGERQKAERHCGGVWWML